MQYKVPQNIDIEDRVIAGLTLRQFMFIMIAGGIGLLEYFALKGPLSFLFLPAAIVTGGVGVAFAFIKINDRPFEAFVSAAIKSLFAPHTRIWQKDEDADIPKHTETPHTRAKVAAPKKKTIGEIKSNLERLSLLVDSGGAAGLESMPERPTNLNMSTKTAEPSDLHDILAKTEEAAPTVDAIMNQAKEYVEKTSAAKEKPVSAMATTAAKPTDFEYEKLALSDEKKLEETLAKVNAEQKALKDKLETAKIEKFER